MSEYRYMSKDGAIYRGRVIRVGDADTWGYYSEGLVGFYDEGYRGYRGYREIEGEGEADSRRALDAWRMAHEFGADRDDALDRVAKRIGATGFVTVALDRGLDIHVAYWGEDPDETRDEVENVWNCEVYRIETERWTGLSGEAAWRWVEDSCEEYYGEDNADAALAEEFDLDEFPAEHVIQ